MKLRGITDVRCRGNLILNICYSNNKNILCSCGYGTVWSVTLLGVKQPNMLYRNSIQIMWFLNISHLGYYFGVDQVNSIKMCAEANTKIDLNMRDVHENGCYSMLLEAIRIIAKLNMFWYSKLKSEMSTKDSSPTSGSFGSS
ncbi:hypothetical protein PPL_05616 [Heterostelium album PN500]|uniref:Uncharacterized protein n=1 Tax=Heterostelium pallidum (strain ATCC 26659 / Pp 5 / PN500) TaxID=670386 RepID=D3BAN8_HETP5|nr:hypothetical protein PPL_05616 [Heterostelium album PN500]EFA81625.1 hypothetical protein PPL_05616 [Heterostelium album PN500]|eukprot:XP_020433742.1 hypothetical protein PPL_05616 [Heterostelium album PN500]